MTDTINQAGQAAFGSPATAPYQFAGFFVRAMAFLVDGMIAGAISWVLGTIFDLDGCA